MSRMGILRSFFFRFFHTRKIRGLPEKIGEGSINRMVENIAPGTYSLLTGGRLVQFTADGLWVDVPSFETQKCLNGRQRGDEVFVNRAHPHSVPFGLTVLEIIEMPLPLRYRELQSEFARMAEILISLRQYLCGKNSPAGNQSPQKRSKGCIKRNIVHRNSSAKSDVWQLHLTRRGQRRARFASARTGRRHDH